LSRFIYWGMGVNCVMLNLNRATKSITVIVVVDYFGGSCAFRKVDFFALGKRRLYRNWLKR